MPIETATYIHDLVSTNPVHTDGIGQNDSHVRLIKQVLLNTFPNLTAALTAAVSDLNNGTVPVGGIIEWSGTVAAIPANWHLCDGSTVGSVVCPDLRGKFVIGVDSDTGTYPKGTTGGALSQTVSSASDGAHSHGSVTGDYALQIADIPTHNHVLTDPGHRHSPNALTGFANIGPYVASGNPGGNLSDVGGSFYYPVSPQSQTAISSTGITIASTGGGGVHSHSISSTGSTHAHSVTVPTAPPYFALAYIIRVT